MKWSWRLGRVFGVEIHLHPSFVFFLVGAGLWWLFLSRRGDPSAEVLFVAAVLMAVLLHEAAHILVARMFGFRTIEAYLLPFAAASRLDRRPADPFHAFVIALAGPLANFAVAVATAWVLWFGGLGAGEMLANMIADLTRFFLLADETAPSPTPGLGILFLEVNLAVAFLNCLPAFPLDGGPALRALLTAFMDRSAALRVAGKIASAAALILAVVGFLGNNVVLGLVGFFVFLSSRQESAFLGARLLVEGLRVRAAMTTQYFTLATYESLEYAMNLLLRSTQNDFPVVGDDGRFMGMLTRNDLIRELSERGPMGRAIDAAKRGERTLSPDEKLDDLLEQWTSFPQFSIPVLEEGKLVGLLNADSVQKFLLVRNALPRAVPMDATPTGDRNDDPSVKIT